MSGKKLGPKDSQAVNNPSLASRPESPHWQMESVLTGSTCPVCSTLPLQNLPTGTEAPSLEYFVNHDLQHQEIIKEWYHRCYLVRLVCDLSRYWSGNSDGHEFTRQGYRYEYTCSANPLWDDDSSSARQYMSVDHDSFLSSSMKAVVVHADPLSRPSAAHLQHWIDTCDRGHEECNFTSTELPTRVLDVGDLRSIKLHHPGSQRDRYLALSHCWGSSKPFITTHSTIDEMKKGFSLEEAPKTFQDAILVTRALNIRYLWIDSLCIIQGDARDWRIESSKMSEVYANSYLTIAAANANDDTEGFLGLRPFKYTPLKITSTTGMSAQVYLQKFDHHPTITSQTPQPLDARAWTLQEQFLSPRTVRFCTEQMTWKCKKGVYTEAERSACNGFMESSVEIIGRRSSWNSLVTGFSQRALTYDTDKLPALVGLVNFFAESHRKMYCTGLWRDEMPHCLLWQRKGGGELPSKYLAPSWSWASLNGPISYSWIGNDGLSTLGDLESVVIHDYHIQTSQESPYGAVQEGAYLRLTAPLAPLKPSANTDRGIIGRIYYEFSHPKDNDVEVWCSFDLARKETREISGLILAYAYRTPRTSNFRQSIRPGRFNHNSVKDGDPPEKLPQNWRNFYGLLVCRSGHAENTYERIGSFEVFEMENGKAMSILENHAAKEVTLY